MTADRLTEVKIYETIQKGIGETDGISFKLISLVPLVSGTALVTIVLGQTEEKTILILLSLFAAAITLGIFWWELWNMRTCHWLISLAEKLEDERFPEPLRVNRPKGIVSKPTGAKIIYGATIFTWLTLAMLIGEPTASLAMIAVYALGVIIAGATIYALTASTES